MKRMRGEVPHLEYENKGMREGEAASRRGGGGGGYKRGNRGVLLKLA